MAGIFVPVIIANSLGLVVLGGVYAREKKRNGAVSPVEVQEEAPRDEQTSIEEAAESMRDEERRRQTDQETQDIESRGIEPEEPGKSSTVDEAMGAVVPVDPTAGIDEEYGPAAEAAPFYDDEGEDDRRPPQPRQKDKNKQGKRRKNNEKRERRPPPDDRDYE